MLLVSLLADEGDSLATAQLFEIISLLLKDQTGVDKPS